MTTRPNVRKLVLRLAGLALSITLAVLLLREVDLNSFAQMATSIPLWSLLAALGCYLLLNFFRLIRFRTLLKRPDIPFETLYPIVLYHNFLVRMLPFKTGELSYVVLLRQHLNQPLREGVSSLISARLFELFMVIVIGGGALLLETNLVNLPVFVSVLIVVVGGLLYLGALYYSGPLMHLAAGIIGQAGTRMGRERLTTLANEKLNVLAGPFDRIGDRRVFTSTLLTSFCTYSMSALFYVVLLYAIGVSVAPGVMIGMVSIVMLAEAVPLATISGLGMIEGGWTFGLVALAGYDIGQAASIGFFLHGCQMLAAGLTGLVGYLWLQMNRREQITGGLDVKQG
jgi:uncharacterized membrane protein YbhN (UPF0104 family)